MILSRLISGLIFTLGGLVLIILSLVKRVSDYYVIALIYGVPLLILGGYLLFNDSEDKIEKIKSRKGGRKNE